MKFFKPLASLLALFIAFSASGQTEKDNFLIGISTNLGIVQSDGSAFSLSYLSTSLSTDNPDPNAGDGNETVWRVNLAPKIGYFVVDNLAVGVDGKFGYNHIDDEDISFTIQQRVYAVGPFVRYYVPLDRNLLFFELYGSYGGINSTSTPRDASLGEEQSFNNELLNFGASSGIAFPLSEKAFCDFALDFNRTRIRLVENNDFNTRTFVNALSLRIGFTLLLGSEKD